MIELLTKLYYPTLEIKTNQFRRVDFQWRDEANRENSQTDRVLFDKLRGPSASLLRASPSDNLPNINLIDDVRCQ